MALISVFTTSLWIIGTFGLEPKRLNSFPREMSYFLEVAMGKDVLQNLYNFYVPSNSSSSACRQDSQLWLHGLKNKNPWAWRMWDSSAKTPYSVLESSNIYLGNFDQCLGAIDGPFKTQYCVIDFEGLFTPRYVDHEDTKTLAGLKIRRGSLEMGLCVPESCTEIDIEKHFTGIYNDNVTVRVNKHACTKKNDIKLNTLDKLVIALSLVIVSFNGLSTLLEHLGYAPASSIVKTAIEAFSINRNLKTILKTPPVQSTMSCINGIRALGMIWIVMGHIFGVLIFLPSANYEYIQYVLTNMEHAIVRKSDVAVDVFFLMSGFLLTYKLLKLKRDNINFLIITIARLLRIMPTYIFLTLSSMAGFYKFGRGPYWKEFFHDHGERCQDTWMSNLLFINNYLTNIKHCNMHTWYLAVDFQLHLLAPVIVYPALIFPKLRKLILTFMLLLSAALSSYTSYIYGLKAGGLLTLAHQTARNFDIHYIKTHARFGAWIVGISLAFIQHQYKKSQGNISKTQQIVGSLLAVVGMVWPIQGSYEMDKIANQDIMYAAIFNGIHRQIWAASISWFIFICTNGKGGVINRILSFKYLNILSNISFSTYLIHLPIIFAIDAALVLPHFITIMFQIQRLIVYMMFSLFGGFMLTLLVELPFNHIGEVVIKERINKCVEEKEEKSQ